MASRALGTRLVLAIAVASAAVSLATTAQARPVGTTATSAGPREDFNGDGYRDLAFAALGGSVSGFAGAGFAGVVYGSSTGLRTATKQVITQNSAGYPAWPKPGTASAAPENLAQSTSAGLI